MQPSVRHHQSSKTAAFSVEIENPVDKPAGKKKSQGYHAAGATISSAERTRRRMNYGRVPAVSNRSSSPNKQSSGGLHDSSGGLHDSSVGLHDSSGGLHDYDHDGIPDSQDQNKYSNLHAHDSRHPQPSVDYGPHQSHHGDQQGYHQPHQQDHKPSRGRLVSRGNSPITFLVPRSRNVDKSLDRRSAQSTSSKRPLSSESFTLVKSPAKNSTLKYDDDDYKDRKSPHKIPTTSFNPSYDYDDDDDEDDYQKGKQTPFNPHRPNFSNTDDEGDDYNGRNSSHSHHSNKQSPPKFNPAYDDDNDEPNDQPHTKLPPRFNPTYDDEEDEPYLTYSTHSKNFPPPKDDHDEDDLDGGRSPPPQSYESRQQTPQANPPGGFGRRTSDSRGSSDSYGSGSKDKFSRHFQEEKKSKGTRSRSLAVTSDPDSPLTPQQRFQRRKSYDYSKSRSTTPLPDIKKIKSSGYGKVEPGKRGSKNSPADSKYNSFQRVKLPPVSL